MTGLGGTTYGGTKIARRQDVAAQSEQRLPRTTKELLRGTALVEIEGQEDCELYMPGANYKAVLRELKRGLQYDFVSRIDHGWDTENDIPVETGVIVLPRLFAAMIKDGMEKKTIRFAGVVQTNETDKEIAAAVQLDANRQSQVGG